MVLFRIMYSGMTPPHPTTSIQILGSITGGVGWGVGWGGVLLLVLSLTYYFGQHLIQAKL